MSTVHDPMKAPISLHGLGFIQVQLQGGQRLHVWHPDLPRRSCFEHSAIHNHRFGFDSRVLVGLQININYRATNASDEEATHRLYLHEGARAGHTANRMLTAGLRALVTHLHGQAIEIPVELLEPEQQAGAA